MGFLDDMQASLDRTTAGANRSIQAAKLKSQMDDALKRRQQLAAQLGASLYEATKDDPVLREGREGIYDRMASIDAERDQIQAQLDELDRQAQQAAYAAVTLTCPFCGARVSQADSFCMGCGKPMAEIKAEIARREQAAQAAAQAQQVAAQQATAQPAGPTCPACGAPVAPDDAFCMSCGQKLK